MLENALLDIRGLDVWYGEAQALRGVDLEVREGEAATLVGRNGASKSTLLRPVMGLHRQVRGSVRLAGRDLLAMPAHKRARRPRLGP